MRQPKEFDIDWEGRRCIVHELGALQARQVVQRITNIVGAALKETGGSSGELDVQVAGLIATGAILERLDNNTIDWLTKTYLKATEVESEAGSERWMPPREVEELVFGGGDGVARWARWIAFCLEMTCADFFRVVFAELMKLQAKTATKPAPNGAVSPSPSTYTTSGTFTG